jgi:DNA-binding transcriptional LysR family regulator
MFRDLLSSSGLSLDRLNSFCAVAEAGGVTKAAGGDPNRQSQFSRQINELEAFFGTELTRRQGTGIVLSAAGVRLAKIAREALSALSDFNRNCKSQPIEVAIGAGDALLQWLLFPQLARLCDEWPAVSFDLQSLRTLEIAERVNDLRLDFGLVRKDAVSPLHHFQSLGVLTYALFVPSRLIKGKQKSNWKDVVRNVPIATIAGHGAFRVSLEKVATDEKLPLKFALSCSSFPQAAKALQSERYAAILPSIASLELASGRFSASIALWPDRQRKRAQAAC